MPPTTESNAACPDITLADDERQPCEVWTRVMGYHRPVASFNIGKQGEHEERQSFVVADTATR
jgi:anaerobic ribonucleoside-triphosphate reductase